MSIVAFTVLSIPIGRSCGCVALASKAWPVLQVYPCIIITYLGQGAHLPCQPNVLSHFPVDATTIPLELLFVACVLHKA